MARVDNVEAREIFDSRGTSWYSNVGELSFDGSASSKVIVPSESISSPIQGFHFSADVTASGSGNRWIMSYGPEWNKGISVGITNGKLKCVIMGQSIENGSMANGQTYKISLDWDGHTMECFIDGQSTGTKEARDAVPCQKDMWISGERWGGGRWWFPGTMSNILISYASAPTQENIVEKVAVEKATPIPMCILPGCGKPTYNGKPGVYCSRTCRSLAAAEEVPAEQTVEAVATVDETAVVPVSRMACEDVLSLDYVPLADFVDKPPPGALKPCSVYILSYGASAMPECAMLQESVDQASRITVSKLSSASIAAMLEKSSVSKAMLFAIIFYTFDLCLVTAKYERSQCWYFQLNAHLRERNPSFLQTCHGYLYYLMTGLYRLVPYGEGVAAIIYRGIDKHGAKKAREEYHDGRRIHWSGFSSATPSLNVAKNFAGKDGLILRIKTLKNGSACRDIRDLSALKNEDEVLLLPNFGMMVTNEAELDVSVGMEVIDLKEQAIAMSTEVF